MTPSERKALRKMARRLVERGQASTEDEAREAAKRALKKLRRAGQ